MRYPPQRMVKFNEIPVGSFFTDGVHIWESVKSGDVINTSFAPKVPVMRCYAVLHKKRGTFEPGQVTEDFFNNNFGIIGNKKIADKLIFFMKEARKRK
jgi:hypothetical protein